MIEHTALAMDVEKYFLDKIVCLSSISKNSLADISNGVSMASEEQAQGLAVAHSCFHDEDLVCDFDPRDRFRRNRQRATRLRLAERHGHKARRAKRAHSVLE